MQRQLRSNRHFEKKFGKRATVIVTTAVCTTVMIGFAALAVDLGYTYFMRAQLQRTADAAAMAAASKLTAPGGINMEAVHTEALKYAQKNSIGDISPSITMNDVVPGKTIQNGNGKFDFIPNQMPYDAVKVTVRLTNDSPNGAVPVFFGRMMGVEEIQMTASAVATLVPRDIVILMDLSNSMSYDSQLRHEPTGINIEEVWEDLGSPTFGNMVMFHSSSGEMPNYAGKTETQIKQLLGINNIPYPYSKGSWDDYIKYVMKGKKSTKDQKSINDEYENRYGLRTFVNYLLDCRSMASETPQLKDCRVQPVHALKQSIEELCNYLILMDSGDQVGLVSYSNNGNLEQELTPNFLTIIQSARAQQAGQLGTSTNIANGIQVGRQELLSSRGRPSAKKIMVVMTDGMANLPSNAREGKLQAINAGHSAVNQGIQIYTISLGTEADTQLMADLAELGKGIHYHVPTLDISQYSEDLKKVFRTLGGKRPIRLIE